MLRQPKIRDAYYEPLKEFSIGFKKFCESYYIEHRVPHPDNEELWLLYIEDLGKRESLRTA